MLLLGMLREGRALSKNTGKPAELEPWTLWVRLTCSMGWENHSDYGSSGPQASMAVASQEPPSVSPTESKARPRPLLSDSSKRGWDISSPQKGYDPVTIPERASDSSLGPDVGPEGRGGREAVKEEAVPGGSNGEGAGLPAFRQPLPHVPQPRFNNFPPPRTPGPPRWRRSSAPACLDLPSRVEPQLFHPGPRETRACALAPPTAALPLPCLDSELPRPLRGGHVDSGRIGRGR